MGIADEDVNAVKAASDIVGIVSQYLQLRREGARWKGLCPFHQEKSPSFSINAEDGLYYCLAGETRVLTYDGVRPIRELAGTVQRVLTEKGRWVDAPFRSFGVQPLMRVTLTRNRQEKVIHATPEHRWLLRGKGSRRYERTTSQLRPGHSLSWSFPRRFAGAHKAWVRRGWVVKSVEPTDRREEVFCAVVEGTHNFTLEDNILTGNCFGCRASGDVITFVREMEKLDFPEAVEWLAAKVGITLHYTNRDEGESRKRKAQLLEVMARAVAWYHERLLSSPDAGAARSYLRGRGLDGDAVREYQLGWAPDSWDELCRSLKLGEKAAKETGLGFRNSRNRLQDTFRARVLFPIFDVQGNPVSFGGRILPGADDPRNQAKYKNTPETLLYHKSSVLYGMDRARTQMVSSDTAVICEGYTDVIGFHRSGVQTAVATCGTSLTDDHIKLLRRYARRLVLAFDADSAGQAAAERLHQWEREHGLEIFVADLPRGKDPADVAQSDPARLVAAVEQAKPFMRFRLDRVFGTADLATPEGRARAAEAALGLLAEHPNVFLRDQYLMDVASRCQTRAEDLRPQLESAVRRHQKQSRHGQGDGLSLSSQGTDGRGADERRSASASGPRHVSPRTREDGRSGRPALEALCHAAHNRDEVMPWLDPVLFANPAHQQVLQSLMASETLQGAIDDAESSEVHAAADLLRRLAVEEPQSEPFDAVRRLLTEVARSELTRLSYATVGADALSSEALSDSAFLNRCINELRGMDTALRAAERLLAWLRQRVGDGG